MRSEDVSETIAEMRMQVVEDLVARHIPEHAYAEQWDAAGLQAEVERIFGLPLPIVEWSKEEGIADEEMRERIVDSVNRRAAERAASIGPETMRYIEKAVLLQTLDHDWREHIIQLDHLRQFVGLRGYGQRDPLNEYKSEALALFEALLVRLRTDVTQLVLHAQVSAPPPPLEERELPEMHAHHVNPLTGEDEMDESMPSPIQMARQRGPTAPLDPNNPRTWGKVSRNAPCPCGSGRKFKHCHGALV
jgi:preprotein translocase subunit SecA